MIEIFVVLLCSLLFILVFATRWDKKKTRVVTSPDQMPEMTKKKSHTHRFSRYFYVYLG